MRSVVTITTGESGSGKSYALVRWVTETFLKEPDGRFISNLPLGVVPEDHSFPPEYEGETFIDRIAVRASQLHGGQPEDYVDRIVLIPEEVLKTWRSGESGPWDYFSEWDETGNHLLIDEFHNFCGMGASTELKSKYGELFGELRHWGWDARLCSQNLGKIPMEIRREAGAHELCRNTEKDVDPLFGIYLEDWYTLKAGFTGSYKSHVQVRTREGAINTPSKDSWKEAFTYELEGYYFSLYDSFSAPQKGGIKGKAKKRQHERLSKKKLVIWFVVKNFGKLFSRFAVALFILWLAVGSFVGLGGGPWLIGGIMDRVEGYSKSQVAAISANDKEEKKQEVKANVPEDEKLVVARKTADEVVADVRTNEEVKEIVATLRKRVEEVEEQNRLMSSVINTTSELVAITDSSITFKNGFSFKSGEVINYGPYNGIKVEKILWKQRSAVLGDGTILRMGGRGIRSATDRLFDKSKSLLGGGTGVR